MATHLSADQFREWLDGQHRRVDALLRSRIDSMATGVPQALTSAMKYSLVDGGKRLRPILCLAFADAVSRATNGGDLVADDAACAVEFIHTYSLIHDDLPSMDDDDMRRGRPTNHKAHGEAMAILAGDALLTAAFQFLSSGRESELALRAQLVSELARAAGAAGMVGGQVLDIAQDRTPDLDYLWRLHGLKTGALLKASCRMGAMAGGADRETIECAERYGESIGLAFQIADDLLDVSATPEAMGKPTGSDAAAGRATFPVVVGVERARALAAELVASAVNAVAPLGEGAGTLKALARYAVERKS
jgi:geranylgeranyl diphosphate synthase type II